MERHFKNVTIYSNRLMYCNRYKVVVVATAFILSLLVSVWTCPLDFNSYARCPNGTHKSSSDDCESIQGDTSTDTSSSSSSSSINDNSSFFNNLQQQSVEPKKIL